MVALPPPMAELSLYDPALNPQLLRCILYCEFDPHLGPRPVFQSPANPTPYTLHHQPSTLNPKT